MPDTVITIPDATEADGTPYEAAEAAVDAVLEALKATMGTLNAASVLARNAELSRQIDLGGQPDVEAWEETVPYRRLHEAFGRVAATRTALVPVRQAVGFDPKKHVT